MFFDDWWSLTRILIDGTLAYVALIFFLRVSGKRTLSKWNAFDFIVTIAFGSVLASVILSKDLALVEGVLALILLIVLQYLITWLSVRVKWIRQLVKAEATMLFSRGVYLEAEMKTQRVTKSEILSAIRASSISAVEDVEAVVLETDGSFSVIKKSGNSSRSALSDVENTVKT